MKKIILYSLMATLLYTIVNCSFLDENPAGTLVSDNFYSNAADAQAAVDATYQQLGSLYGRNMYLVAELPTDVVKNGIGMPNTFLQNLEFMRYNTENSFISDMWKNNFSGIMKANAAINNIPRVTSMLPELQARLIAEAKFLRGLYYFNLVRFFGDVPLILKLDKVEDGMGARIPKEQIYTQITTDLTDAALVLPYRTAYGGKDVGRVTKGSANILLGKVYLTMGDFQKAKTTLEEVVTNEGTYGYALHADYRANWNIATEAGSEAVLYIEYKAAPSPSNGEMGLTGPKYSIKGTVGIGGSNEADIPTLELYESYEATDTRRDVNIKFDFMNPKTGKNVTSSIPLFGKYWQNGITAMNQCEVNMHIIRYADAILMYAEALNEVGESGKAHENLNRVRERAFKGISENYAGLSQDAFRTAILQERFLELPLEGHRWFDLVRTGTFIQRMKDHSAYEANVAEANKTDIAANIKDHMILMPIPQREMDLNPLLVQNPGW